MRLAAATLLLGGACRAPLEREVEECSREPARCREKSARLHAGSSPGERAKARLLSETACGAGDQLACRQVREWMAEIFAASVSRECDAGTDVSCLDAAEKLLYFTEDAAQRRLGQQTLSSLCGRGHSEACESYYRRFEYPKVGAECRKSQHECEEAVRRIRVPDELRKDLEAHQHPR